VHYTPSYAYWLHQVERWFGTIMQRPIRKGRFSGVKKLIAKIDQFLVTDDKSKAPFKWIVSGLNPGDDPAALLADLQVGTLTMNCLIDSKQSLMDLQSLFE
jgi:hypothetical protein